LVGTAVVIAVGCVVGFLVTEVDTTDVGAQPSASVSTSVVGTPSSAGSAGDDGSDDPSAPGTSDPVPDGGSDSPRAVGPFRISNGRVAFDPGDGYADLLIWNDSGDELVWDVDVDDGSTVRVDPASGRLGAREVAFARVSATGPEGGPYRLTPRGNGGRSYTIVVSGP
jgi:hypothetical protein